MEKMTSSQFELGRRENFKRDYHKNRYDWGDSNDSSWSQKSTKFEYLNSTETTETEEGFEFRIPLSEISLEDLKITVQMNYIIVQSNKKTIFISLDRKLKSETLESIITQDMLVIKIKK